MPTKFYFHIKPADGEETFLVSKEDFLLDHKEITIDTVRTEISSILSRDKDQSQHESTFKLEYRDKQGEIVRIQVPRELTHALKEHVGMESLHFFAKVTPNRPTAVAAAATTARSLLTEKRAIEQTPATTPRRKKAKPSKAPAAAAVTPVPSAATSGENVAGLQLDKVPTRILTALAELHSLGIDNPSRNHVCLLSGYTNTDSTGFRKGYKKLKDEGLIISSSTNVSLSEKGKALGCSDANKPKSNVEMKDRLLNLVRSPKARAMYEYLSDGRAHPRMEVLSALGYTHLDSSGFRNAMSEMKGLGVIDCTDKRVRLTDIAFPYGRPDHTDTKHDEI